MSGDVIRAARRRTPGTTPAITSRQQKVLDFICEFSAGKGYAPTLREIGEHMGISSTTGVRDHLLALARKGHLVRDGKTSRTMRVAVGSRVSATIQSEEFAKAWRYLLDHLVDEMASAEPDGRHAIDIVTEAVEEAMRRKP